MVFRQRSMARFAITTIVLLLSALAAGKSPNDLHTGVPSTGSPLSSNAVGLQPCLEKHIPQDTETNSLRLRGAGPAPPTKVTGLVNIGNTCFFNSVLQNLIHSRCFSTRAFGCRYICMFFFHRNSIMAARTSMQGKSEFSQISVLAQRDAIEIIKQCHGKKKQG
jgi:hypothetical protein